MTAYEPPSGHHQAAPPTTGQPAPGWYPVDSQSQRYWDGYEWTNHLAPLNNNVSLGLTDNDRTYALIMHLGGLFGGILVPLIMWLIKKEDSPFINHHGRQAMNFHLSMMIYMVLSIILIVAVVGLLMILVLIIWYVVFSIVAAMASSRGEYYKFPAVITFFS